MHKFIEIPIYALDKSTLRVRYVCCGKYHYRRSA